VIEPRQGTTRSDILTLVLMTIIAGIPLLGGRALGGHDIINYLIVAQQTAANLREGIVFPAWAGGFNAGFGSPLLIFFPPLTGYVHSLWVLAGIPVAAGVCISAVVAHFLSGVAMCWWLRSTGVGHPALPAAVVYMVAPYRLVDLYFRSALGEHWSFLWPPLILGVASSRRLSAPAQAALLALLIAALVTTNLPLAVLFGIGLAAWFLISDQLQNLRVRIVGGVILGFAIAAFALVPQALAPSYLNLDACFGRAATRMQPSANTLFADGFTIWNVNTVLSVVMLASFALVMLAHFLTPEPERRRRGAWLAALAAVACLMAATGPAGRVWDALPVLSKLQFPWRATAVMTLLAAAVTGRLPLRRAWFVAAVAATFSIPAMVWNRTLPISKFRPDRPPHSERGSMFPDPEAAWETGSGGWYWRHHNLVELCLLPKSMKPSMMRELAGSRMPAFDSIRGRAVTVMDAPSASVKVLKWGQAHRVVEIDSPTDSTLVWRVLDFPEMIVAVDRAQVPVKGDPTTGLVSHPVPGGRHMVSWSWRPFPELVAARVVSLAGAVATAWLAFTAWGGRRARRHLNEPDPRIGQR
jgi:hypothetical protein